MTDDVRAEPGHLRVPRGPSEVIRPYLDAGFDRVVLMNTGPDPDGFLDFFRDDLAARLRTSMSVGVGRGVHRRPSRPTRAGAAES